MGRKKHWLIVLIVLFLIVTAGIGTLLVFFNRSLGNSDAPLSETDFQQLEEVNALLDSVRGSSEYAAMDEDEQMAVMLETIKDLSKEGKINGKTIYCDEKAHYISYQYKCGVLGSESFGGHKKGYISSGGRRNRTIDNKGTDVYFNAKPNSKGKSLILNSLAGTGFEEVTPVCRNTAIKWSKKHIDTRLVTNVTLDDFLDFRSYDTVVILIHGYEERFSMPMTLFGDKYLFTTMKLEQKVNDKDNRNYAKDLKAANIVTHSGCYAVAPGFIKSHYSAGELKGKIFYIATCMLMGVGDNDSELWTECLVNHAGVSAFVGYHNEIKLNYGVNGSIHFMAKIIEGENAQTAYDEIISKLGRTDGDDDSTSSGAGYPVLRGDGNAVIKWKEDPKPDQSDKTEQTSAATPSPTPPSSSAPSPTPAPESQPEQTSVPTEAPEPTTDSKVTVEDAHREEYDYYDGKLVNCYPKITIRDVDTSAINNKMARELTTRIKQTGENEYSGKAVKYKYYIGKNIVSIVATLEECEFEWFECKVYNISIATGKEVSYKKVLSEYGISEKKFLEAVKNQYRNFGAGVDHASEASKKKIIKMNLKLASFKYVRPYFSEEGKLCFVGKVWFEASYGYGDMFFTVP